MIETQKFLEHCPFCNAKFKSVEDYVEYKIYSCHFNDTHTYIQKVWYDTQEVMEIKLRLGTGEHRNYMKINYFTKVSQVWRGRNNTPGRVNIDEIIKIDLDNQEDIIRKIKLYITLS